MIRPNVYVTENVATWTYVATVASLGGGRTAQDDTLQGGDTRRKKFCGQIYKE